MSYTRRRFLAASGALAVAGCGGGAGGPQYVGTPPPLKPRTDILYGYFGDAPGQAVEVADHTNLYMSAPWYGIDGAIDNIRTARAAGLAQLVVMVDADILGEPVSASLIAKGWLQALRAAGCFQGMTVKAIYWRDEPNDATVLPVRSDAYVRETNGLMRAMLASDFPELGPVGMWTIFADAPDLPGLDDWDGVGGDRYGQGCNVLGQGALIDRIGRGMKRGAGRIVVPSPCLDNPVYNPGCFETYAQGTPDVIAVMPFIWPDGWGSNPAHLGIRSIAPDAYRALGKKLTGK
jgi:hypothetical protein